MRTLNLKLKRTNSSLFLFVSLICFRPPIANMRGDCVWVDERQNQERRSSWQLCVLIDLVFMTSFVKTKVKSVIMYRRRKIRILIIHTGCVIKLEMACSQTPYTNNV